MGFASLRDTSSTVAERPEAASSVSAWLNSSAGTGSP